MYRIFLTILLWVHAATAAPQTLDSDVTYVKIQPMVEDNPTSATNIRESRIEKLPLTIPGNITTDLEDPDKNISLNLEGRTNSSESQDYLTESQSELSENVDRHDDLLAESTSAENPEKSELTDADNLSEDRTSTESNFDTKAQSDLRPDDLSEPRRTILSGSPTDLSQSDNSALSITPPEIAESNKSNLSELKPDSSEPSPDLSESDSENISDAVPLELETSQSDRQARNFDSTETTDAIETTEKYVEIDHTIIEIPTRPPKFIPKVPKLSYFQKPRVFQSYSSNFVENSSKRRFRSRCRCEKIWNCPKLQISVPRCPNEYFLCCF